MTNTNSPFALGQIERGHKLSLPISSRKCWWGKHYKVKGKGSDDKVLKDNFLSCVVKFRTCKVCLYMIEESHCIIVLKWKKIHYCIFSADKNFEGPTLQTWWWSAKAAVSLSLLVSSSPPVRLTSHCFLLTTSSATSILAHGPTPDGRFRVLESVFIAGSYSVTFLLFLFIAFSTLCI